MDFEFYLDLLMIVLLLATIIYALMLNRRLAAFRRNREDMEQFLSAFHAATERAEILIQSLKEMASQSGDALREDIERASGLHEDLSFMVDRGDAIANRLEKAASGVNAARKKASSDTGLTGQGGGGAKPPLDERNDRVGIETRAEELAARMVRDTEMTNARNAYDGGGGRNGGGDDRSSSSLSRDDRDRRANLLDDEDSDQDAGRSDAERELLAALRSVR
jgi:mevalonate kinase